MKSLKSGNETLKDIEAARSIVYQHMKATPAYSWPLLNQRTGCEAWVKHENHTPVGAFKVRGGLVCLTNLKARHPEIKGIISATRGNHGQSLSFAAARLGVDAVIVVPHGNNPEKNLAMKALNCELIEHGKDFQEALEFTQELAEKRPLHIIGPYNQSIINGVATYALEFFEQVKNLDTVYVPIGMGSGISGLIRVRDALSLETEIVGVVAQNAPAYALSFEAGSVVTTETAETLADGVACRIPLQEAVGFIRGGAARVISVSEDEILDAIKYYFVDTHNLAEGAGSVPLAGLLKEKAQQAGKRVGLILSGGNVDRSTLIKALGRPDH